MVADVQEEGTMAKTIQYGIDTETGLTVSRIGSEAMIPVLEYEKMTPENNFQTSYRWEKDSIYSLRNGYDNYKWTRKLSVQVKNFHRKLWGMKPLPI